MDQEIEVKFYLADLPRFRQNLILAGASQTHPRVLETNLRFDTPGMDLSKKSQVLRLRQDQEAHLTFKGPGELVDGALTRQEIEFEVSDFQTARRFLERLGYRVFMTYEKVRENFTLQDVQVSIDDMPYGYFAELEGQSARQIQAVADSLSLDWSRRINTSYLDLFQRLKERMGLKFDDLSFDTFRDLAISPEDLDVIAGDGSPNRKGK
ncbi:MAG: class IV adenylate cyclase [Anaerolineaceae bacterium]